MAERGRGTGIVLERVDRPSHDGGALVPSRRRFRDLIYGWPETPGITGRIAVEWVAGLPWNPQLRITLQSDQSFRRFPITRSGEAVTALT
jgi:hypothetical protein